MTFHWYCSFYFMLVDKNKEKCCLNSFCRMDLTASGSLTFFAEVSIVQQMKRFFAKTGFYNDIQHHHNRDSKCGQICDIYDGKLYKELSKHSNVLTCLRNISFTWNTHGVPIFTDRYLFPLWPLYLVIDEQSPKKQFSKDNMILAGLWFGCHVDLPQTLPFILKRTGKGRNNN